MGQWFCYFLGTPQRAVRTFTVVGLITVIAYPGLLRHAVEQLIVEVSPLFGPLLTLAIIIWAFRLMTGLAGGGGHGKKRRR